MTSPSPPATILSHRHPRRTCVGGSVLPSPGARDRPDQAAHQRTARPTAVQSWSKRAHSTLSRLPQAPQAAVEPALHGPWTPKPRPPCREPGRFDLRQNGGPNRTPFQPLEALVREARFRRAKRKSAERSPRRLQLVLCDSARSGPRTLAWLGKQASRRPARTFGAKVRRPTCEILLALCPRRCLVNSVTVRALTATLTRPRSPTVIPGAGLSGGCWRSLRSSACWGSRSAADRRRSRALTRQPPAGQARLCFASAGSARSRYNASTAQTRETHCPIR